MKRCLTVLLMLLVSAAATPRADTPADPSDAAEAVAEPVAAPADAAAVTAPQAQADTDTTAAFPEKRHAHAAWETALALPGYVIYLPFWAVFSFTGATIKVVDETGALDRMKEWVTFADGRGGIYPAYSGSSGAGLSFFLKDYFNEDFRFDATATYGRYDRSLFRIRYRRLEIFNGALITGLNLRYRNMPDERFFGIGPEAPKSPQTNFRQQLGAGELTLGHRITTNLDLNAVGAIEYNKIDEGRNPRYSSTDDEYPGLPGFGKDVTFARFGLRAVWDGRNNLFRPSSGVLAAVDGSMFQQTGNDEYGYTQVFAEFRQFIPLWQRRVLVLRANGWFVDPLSDRGIPFYALPEHGSDETVRGYRRGRFRDRDAVLATAEYRWPIWRTIDALLFTDASHVASNIFNDFDSNHIKWSFGGGFRLYTGAVRRGQTDFGSGAWLMFAQGDDGFRVHFRWN